MGVKVTRSWSPSVYLHTYSCVEDQSREQRLILCSASLQGSEWQLASLTQWEKVRLARSEHDWAGQALSAEISFTRWMQFLPFLFLWRNIQHGNKRQLFSLLMSGQGESRSEKVHICHGRMGSLSAKACQGRQKNSIGKLFENNNVEQQTHTYYHTLMSMNGCEVRG